MEDKRIDRYLSNAQLVNQSAIEESSPYSVPSPRPKKIRRSTCMEPAAALVLKGQSRLIGEVDLMRGSKSWPSHGIGATATG